MKICPPAIIYLIFSLTQIIIDIFKGLYNTSVIKFIVMVMITILLNILCENGLGVISWIIVFVPFILMTVIVSLLLYIFGLKASTGTLNFTCDSSMNQFNDVSNNIIHKDSQGNIIIYKPYYDPLQHPVYYSSPNIVIPPSAAEVNNYNTIAPINNTANRPRHLPVPTINNWSSSSPAYQTH